MKKVASMCGLLGLVLSLTLVTSQAQTSDFGDRAAELRGINSDEMAHPDIPDDAVADAPAGTPGVIVPRPLYLVYRYYSCVPWLRVHVRSVHSTVPGWDPSSTEIDTANDDPDGQLVRDVNHAAYGLYCLRVVICVPYAQWQRGVFHRF
jgi:hypothetical protein